jgi:hypothetical protein
VEDVRDSEVEPACDGGFEGQLIADVELLAVSPVLDFPDEGARLVGLLPRFSA